MNTFNGTRKRIEHGGEERTIAEIAAASGLSIWLIYDRWRKGDREERLVRPSRNRAGCSTLAENPLEREEIA